ncbi:MAG: acyltransferase family protein [Capsulimonadaceae bacterium]
MNKRLLYLDGLRAVAAVYVVVAHAVIEVHGRTGPTMGGRVSWSDYDFASVSLFIVLSGYCLTLPLLSGKSLDVVVFFRKRARRILPPYFAALVFSYAALVFRPKSPGYSIFWQSAGHAWDPDVILSHLFMVHNLSIHWYTVLDYPMWSIATEWQIYLLFPFLLWIRAKGSTLTPVIAALAIGISATLALAHINENVDTARPHLLAMFALGMLACWRTHDRPVSRYFYLWPLFLLGAYIAVSILFPTVWRYGEMMSVAAGFVGYNVIVGCDHPDSPIRRLMEAPLLVWIGGYSYSLYLVHAPILAIVRLYTTHVILVGLPLSLAVSYAFFLLFERPYLRSRIHQATVVAAEPAKQDALA